ncbi:MAG: family 10 glycosylhydrolase [Gemmatimonadetes bacterium]|nr:family 10 glycosylhydrolase [Gemmatimonadota bacterium]
MTRSCGEFRRGFCRALVAVVVLSGCTLVGGPLPEAGPQPTRGGRPAAERGGQPAATERPPVQPSATPPATTAEVHALWVVRSTLTHADSIRAMVRRAAEAGFGDLIVQVRGRGDAYYRGRWEPPPANQDPSPDQLDPLALAIREAHARGLRVHAWVNAHLLASAELPPDDPRHLFNSGPGLLAVARPLARALHDMDPNDDRYRDAIVRHAREHSGELEGVYTAPAHPEVKEHVYSVVMDVVERYDVDGIHLDYVRFPGPDFDYSRAALDGFREWTTGRLGSERRAELDAAATRDPLAFVDALPELWDDFRREQITELVERVYYGVKKRKPPVVVSAALFANAEDAYRNRFQDWATWLRQGILDVAVLMAYTPDSELFRRQLAAAVEAAGGLRPVWAGIGAYSNTVSGTVEKIRIARTLGARGISLFSYDWAVTPGNGNPSGTYLVEVARAAFTGP